MTFKVLDKVKIRYLATTIDIVFGIIDGELGSIAPVRGLDGYYRTLLEDYTSLADKISIA